MTGEIPNTAATATALVPDEAVSPTPRSQTRASITSSATARATWTFVRRGKRSCTSSIGPTCGSTDGSPSTTACGFPTSTATRAMPATSSGEPIRPRRDPARRGRPPSMRARTSRGPTRTATALGTRLLGEPARGDPRAVARHLGARAVRVPDCDLDPVVALAERLDDAVRTIDLERARARESATPQ